MNCTSVWSVVIGSIAALCAAPCAAQSFRIESQVYEAEPVQLIAESLTLFDQGLVLDFTLELSSDKRPIEIIIFDTRRKSFVLLDCQRQVKLTLEQYELVRMLEEARRELSQQDSLAFLADPQLVEEVNLADSAVELTSPHFTYRVLGERPKDDSLLAAYHEYLDAFARLSASDPRRLPPFTRLQVNQSLRKLGWIPREVELWIHSDALPRHRVHWLSKHHSNWTLSDADRQRIDSAKRDWQNFKSVNLREYRQITATAQAEDRVPK